MLPNHFNSLKLLTKSNESLRLVSLRFYRIRKFKREIIVYYNMTKYQKRCIECSTKMKRLYIREYGVKDKWIPIGWYCSNCNGIIMDNDVKYVSFNKYHLLEFDYKQLRRNMDKLSLLEK